MTPTSRRKTTAPRRSAQKLTSARPPARSPNYARRRLVFVAGLFAAVALCVAGGMWLYGVVLAAVTEQDEVTSTGPTYFTGQPAACEPDVLTWTWQPAGGAAGSSMAINYTVTNTGTVPCLVEASGANLVVTVTSGDDRVYSTADCASEDDSLPLLLGIGDSTERTLTWNGQRSAVGCEAAGGAAQAGTYAMTVTYGGATVDAGNQVFYLY